MSGFDLLSLNPTLLEMVINKLDEKSYFRLQQTNKMINDFIHNSKNICVHLPESYHFDNVYFKNEEIERNCYEMDVECLYGVQFAKLYPNDKFFSKNSKIYEQNCDNLKKCRITCDKLDLSYFGHVSVKKMTMLIDIVKPRIASVDCNHYDEEVETFLLSTLPHRCVALLQPKTLKEVHISLDLKNTALIVPLLFLTVSSVHIKIKIYDGEEQIEVLRTMLKVLRSNHFPNLQNFSLFSYPHPEYADSLEIEFEEVKEEFKFLNWAYEREGEDDDCKDRMEDDDLVSGCEGEDHEDEKCDEEKEGIENEMSVKEEEEIKEETIDDGEVDDDAKDQMEKEFDDLVGGCEEEDHDVDESEKAEYEQVENEEKGEEEEDLNEDAGDHEDEDDFLKQFEAQMLAFFNNPENIANAIAAVKLRDDSEDDRYLVEKLTATLELPNGPCKIVWEKSTENSNLSMELGDRKCF